MNIQKSLKGLCQPAHIYFVISMIAFVFMVIQNLGNTHTYVCGMYQCSVENTTAVFVGKVLYVLFWTWLLNVFCKAGYEKLSWFLVIFPFVLMFVLFPYYLVFLNKFQTMTFFTKIQL